MCSKQSHRRSDVSVLTEDMMMKVVCLVNCDKTFGNESEVLSLTNEFVFENLFFALPAS